jgi:hypothetical protein
MSFASDDRFGVITHGILTIACTVFWTCTMLPSSCKEAISIDLDWMSSATTFLKIGDKKIATAIYWDDPEDCSEKLFLLPMCRERDSARPNTHAQSIMGLVLREVDTSGSHRYFARLGLFEWYIDTRSKETGVSKLTATFNESSSDIDLFGTINWSEEFKHSLLRVDII